MAKEWDKFQADYKKLAPEIKKYSEDNAFAASKRLGIAFGNCSEGESHLAHCMVTARKNGVTGNNLSDFVKDKTFSEGLKLLDKATSDLTTELRALEKFSKDAAELSGKVDKLKVAIEKDLKGRKDKSASKKDIEALLATTIQDVKQLNKSARTYEGKANKAMTGYAAAFQKTVAGILKQAPDAQKADKESMELPQLFVDRNIKKNFSTAIGTGKKISDLCDAAMTKAETDLKAATPDLKAAADLLKTLKALNDSYVAAVAKQKAALDNSKDKDKIVKTIAAIAKSYDNADRKLRGTMTTIKKAG